MSHPGRTQEQLFAAILNPLRSLTGHTSQGPGCNDVTGFERCINIATSLPFVAIGLQGARRRTTAEGRRAGISVMVVGLAATLYHSTSGNLRRWCRKADYWTISVASAQMVKASHPLPSQKWTRRLSRASLMAMPFQPTAVTSLNAALIQVPPMVYHAVTFELPAVRGPKAEFLRSGKASPAVLKAHRQSAASLAAGLAAFQLEDAALARDFHLVHALWHTLSMVAIGKSGVLIQFKEEQHQVAMLKAAGLSIHLTADASNLSCLGLGRSLQHIVRAP
eukprot:jgi/Astpho2/2785/Aster-x1097